jgi:hypothetical protein
MLRHHPQQRLKGGYTIRTTTGQSLIKGLAKKHIGMSHTGEPLD